MAYMQPYIDVTVAMTATQESAEMFESCMPESCVHREFSEAAIQKILDHQNATARKKKPLKHVLIVLDDLMFDKRVVKGQNMREIYMNGRHCAITLMITAQYCMDLGPELRSQIDYCFCLREPVVANRIKLWKYFFGGFETFDDFSLTYSQCTSDNECIAIDNTVKSNELEDFIFWYKANINMAPYKLGGPSFWKAHSTFYYTDEEMDEMRERYTQMHDSTRGAKKRIVSVEKETEEESSKRRMLSR
ncbi:MAG: hypothetical protein CL916_03215 [Deltaproteobacteria bacterium]|nr:hypothetical protein [Deltaproteobacteria bacterium]